jgi:hypothetical protein
MGLGMNIGLKRAARGSAVARLHRVLISQGFPVEPGELSGQEFGVSTLSALHALQARHGLPRADEVDAACLKVLIELEEHITININEGGSPPPPPKPDEHHGVVHGNLVNGDGGALGDIKVALFSILLRSEAELGHATTDAKGQYRITYRRTAALNLLMRAYDAAGTVTAQSATVFQAAATVEIDFSTAKDGVVRSPSQFTALEDAVTAGLHGTPLTELKENKETHELTFLASSICSPFGQVANLYIATALGQKNRLRPETLYGVFNQGTPVALAAALTDLPDAGIDDAFTSQVFAGVLAVNRAQLNDTLTAAVTGNILPASYADVQAEELSRLDALRVTSVGSAPYVRGKTPLNDLLAAGAVPEAVRTAFVQAYADNAGNLGPTWKTLRANKSLPAADLATLNTVLSTGELLTGNLPLVKDTLQRLAAKSLAGVQDLALLDQSDWEARIREVDPEATSIPQVLPNDTPADRIARFALQLANRFAGRFPTTAFVGGLTKAPTTSFTTKPELISFLSANPKLNFRATNIDHFIATNKLTISPPALAELKTVQRLHRISPHYSSVEPLHAAGYKSAQHIYFKGRDPFLAEMTAKLGSKGMANMAFARAQMTYSTALMSYGRFKIARSGATVAAMNTAQPDASTLANLPDMEVLFGSQDYFACADCQSVLSPAAYLVDLLQYLTLFSVTPATLTVSSARDALLHRRPDIQYVALTCDNTNVTIPYIDLVNEVLEAAIAPAAIPRPTLVDTQGTTAERLAVPQQTQPAVAAAAYAATNTAVFPLSLPFDVNFAQTTAFIAAMGTTRAAIMNLFPGAATPAVLAGAALGINAAMQAVIDQANTTTPWTRWGLTNAPFPNDWVTTLSQVPALLSRSGLSLLQLYQLLEVVWVTQDSVTLQLGSTTLAGVPVLSADTADMKFNGLTGDVLDRANRFLRLWTATGLQMWELDWALGQTGGSLDDSFLEFLATAVVVKTQLNLPFQEVLTFWGPIETRDVTSHLGDEDVVVPSTYSEIFASATMSASWGSVFPPPLAIIAVTNTPPIGITTAFPHGLLTGAQVTISGVQGTTTANGPFTITVTGPSTFTLAGSSAGGAWIGGGTVTTLSGAPIVFPSATSPTAVELQPLNGIIAALGLSSADISAILAASGAANALTLSTLTALVRYQRLAAALSLSVSDLILWIALAGRNPFGSPADTAEFLRRLGVLQGTSIAIHDLDYLLRGQSAAQSSLAFTAAQLAADLQTIRDAVVKAVAAGQITLSGITPGAPIAVTTSTPHGYTTGMQVFVGGVQGNTAANGFFTITVNSPTTFTLNGSSGSVLWTGGGTVTAYTATLVDAIQTFVVASLATATNVTADVVTPVLSRTNVLPLPGSTIDVLLNNATVDPSQVPALVTAVTQVANACSLYTALGSTPAAFAFIVQYAATFRWLDPISIPLTPVLPSPYGSFELLLQALKLQQRQSARSPKLFDVFGQWLLPGQLPADAATAIGGPTIAVTNASNSTPIVITTAAPHGMNTGTQVAISLVVGNTAANGTYTITYAGPTSFALDGSVGNGAWVSGGVVTDLGVPSLAQALNATITDVATIAAALGANPPTLTSAAQPGTLTDVALLSTIADALDLVSRYKIDGPTLKLLASPTPSADTSAAAMGAFQSQYAQTAWLAAVQQVENTLRQARRDALVAYLLGPGPATATGVQFQTTDDIYNYYLIDPEMCACGQATRLLQPSLAIQQFVQQCFLNLTFGVTVNTADSNWSEWSWRQQFRLWQANREVFLYPENYVLPELRTNASPFFSDLESDLRQSNCDADAAEAAFENYLRKLVGVANLVVAAHYNLAAADGTSVLYVFAHTRGTPPKWFYRTRSAGAWNAWEALNLDIQSDHLVPVVWDQRLFLIWPVFKPESEKGGSQAVPTSTSGGTSPPAQKIWAVEFAMSEFSAGQWQPKRSINEKMFFYKNDINSFGLTERPPQAFTFRAWQDPSFNLQIQTYYSLCTANELLGAILGAAFGANVTMNSLQATGTLSTPDAPLTVVQNSGFPLFPDYSLVDTSQEPSYLLVQSQKLSGSLATPAGYGFSGQDLISGLFFQPSFGSVSLNVPSQTTSGGQITTYTLLKSITNPRLVIPAQEPVFDSMDPFFVSDANRTYLVQPHYYTVSSRPQELGNLAYTKQWSTRYQFETFYHPYARTLLRELEIGGVARLMSRSLQTGPQAVRGWQTFNFASLYNPTQYVLPPYPGVNPTADPGETWLDFETGSGGPYSLYNWEVFYHAPMFVAAQLMQNQQYQETMTWLEYIFNPTDSSNGWAPQRFWEFAPFNAMNSSDWVNNQIQNLLGTLAASTLTGNGDQVTATAIQAWMNDPYDPHMVASTRISAYGMATVMKFLDNLIAWGDSLYAQYTAEMVSQAEQLYVMADMILGPAPSQVRPPAAQQTAPATYASLKNLDLFSNVLVNVENVIVAPEPPQSLVQGTAQTPTLPQFPSSGNTLLFCIPPNDTLLAYWGTVAQRLYNIRHCLNLQGVAQPLPLYAPPINPLQLIAEKASGASPTGGGSTAPVYRFATYLQRAVELANDVRAYGALILAALEKQDAETLAVLRATQELDIQTRLLDIKARQVTEAQDQIAALQNQKAVVQIRYNFYSTIAFMNTWESIAMVLQGAALIANGVAVILDLTSGVANAVPSFSFGAAGFGGSPMVTASYGGQNVGSAATSFASVARGLAGILSEGGGMAATMGGYQRRQDEWTLQANLANAELTQIASEITAANDRLGIAQSELSIQTEQIANAQAISDFLTNKYTNAQLYNWMVTQLTTVYTQAYQLAFGLALQAQTAYQYELGRPLDTFISPSYWDSQHKGLTAGESLLFDLRRMDAQYLANNVRELELTKHVSLALTHPMQLVLLLQTGSCTIPLDETLFDRDHPGLYFRRLRSVALTIPCVAGPYTGVNATLSLASSVIRTVPPAAGFQPLVWSAVASNTDQNLTAPPTPAGIPMMVTSSGQNDAGMFELNHRDERWLPFEGQGAISNWSLSLDPRDNNFDVSSVTDVVVHLRFTARVGGDAVAVRKVLKDQFSTRCIMISVRNTFGDAYYSLFNPTDTTSPQQALVLPLTSAIFPYSNLGTPNISAFAMYFMLTQQPAAGTAVSGTFGPTGSTGPAAAVSFPAVPQTTSAGTPVAALGATVPVSPSVTPQSFTLTVPAVPPALGVKVNGQMRFDPTKVEDILLLVTYDLG